MARPVLLRLTEAGLMLLPHARRVINKFEDVRAALDGVSGQPCGLLRINAAMRFVFGLVAPMIPGFFRRFPEIRVHLQTKNRIVDVAREDVDVTIRIGALPDSGLIARRLGAIALWLCASPVYLRQHGIPETPSDLTSHTLLGWTDRPESWRFTNMQGQDDIISVPVGSTVPESAALKILLKINMGTGGLPDFLGLSATSQLSSKVRVFIDALRARLAHGAGESGGSPGR
ncbi:substrate binding domain-containing protein [Gluconobacter morbifer]|nr:substrate binding domain-containing protein [Gluconobacter morbifer]